MLICVAGAVWCASEYAISTAAAAAAAVAVLATGPCPGMFPLVAVHLAFTIMQVENPFGCVQLSRQPMW